MLNLKNHLGLAVDTTHASNTKHRHSPVCLKLCLKRHLRLGWTHNQGGFRPSNCARIQNTTADEKLSRFGFCKSTSIRTLAATGTAHSSTHFLLLRKTVWKALSSLLSNDPCMKTSTQTAAVHNAINRNMKILNIEVDRRCSIFASSSWNKP